MEIIAEKINGTRKEVKAAVANRDAGFIQELARTQAQCQNEQNEQNASEQSQHRSEYQDTPLRSSTERSNIHSNVPTYERQQATVHQEYRTDSHASVTAHTVGVGFRLRIWL